MITTIKLLAWAYLASQPAQVATAEATLTVKRGIWPRPLYLTSMRVMPPAGQRVVVWQCVGAGWIRWTGEVQADGEIR